jgi:hypothetical protein
MTIECRDTKIWPISKCITISLYTEGQSQQTAELLLTDRFCTSIWSLKTHSPQEGKKKKKKRKGNGFTVRTWLLNPLNYNSTKQY